MEISDTGSLINLKIGKFYKINEDIIFNETISTSFLDDCTFNWSYLEQLLLAGREWSEDGPVFPKTYYEYFTYFKRLQPVLQASQKAINESVKKRNGDMRHLFDKLQWLGHQDQMKTIMKEYQHPSFETSTVENVLFLTSLLENALANVYYTITKKCPPHLLRDLLDTKELRHFFGICPILFLKIIMGSPESVNLRNIVWHGFPLPSEVPSFYVATLLIAGASLFVLIDEQQLQLESRQQITDFSRFVSKIKATSLDITFLDDFSQMIRSIADSKWTGHTEHKSFWYRIIQHYENENYWHFIILILPQIELLLRRMYGEANDFDISAKLEEYYITMNTIFESKDNRLLNGGLCTGILHLLYDVFISPYGMRIRDKVSHGEVDLNCINKDLCSILLYAGLNLITCNQVYPLNHYESRFHLNCLAYESIDASKKSVLEMMSLKTPSSFGIDYNWDQKSIAALQDLELIRPVKIFNRYKKEPELVAILMKIAQLVVQVCENYKISFTERFRMFVNHELRSRARNTLNKMVKTINVVGIALENIVQFSVELNNLMQTENKEWFDETFVRNLRFCKQTLSIVENLVKYSDRESNEWLSALDCCLKFNKLSQNSSQMLRKEEDLLEIGEKYKCS